MYTFEVNVICDHCENECVTGSPLGTVEEAKESAIKEAEANGWDFSAGKWACSECFNFTPEPREASVAEALRKEPANG